MNKRIFTSILLIIIGAAAGVAGYYLIQKNKKPSVSLTGNTSSKKERKILYWRAPMNPKEIYNHPGKSNMGMDLVPVYADEGGESGVVSINPVIEQDMNVKITTVKSGKLHADIYTNGNLQPDERNEFTVTTKTGGWIEKMYIDYTGQKVHKGDNLIKIYSPELVSAQEEYLTALAYDKAMKNTAAPSSLLKNAIRKLQLLDVSKNEIQQLKETMKVKKYIILKAPFSGTVLEKKVETGAKISRGTPLLKIANLSNLWIWADIYAYELDKIQLQLPVKVTIDYLPGKSFNGNISFINPTVNKKTRTVKVRIEIPNKKGLLKPGMFANVDITGKSLGVYPLVPEQAILRSGRKNTVIISLGNGKFKPAEVELGGYADGYYQILKGLNAGTKIVTSAQFLIDSESSLRASLDMFSGSDNKKKSIKKNIKKQPHNNSEKNDKNQKDSELIRKGVINVEAIDKNNDGILYQDIMDWNVISDKPGTCPVCGMKLRKMTIKQVKHNLKEHGFQYK